MANQLSGGLKDYFWKISNEFPYVLNIFSPSARVQESIRGFTACGFIFTAIYLAVAIVIIALYWHFEYSEGPPLIVHHQYVSHQRVLNGSVVGYSCSCHFPPEILSYVGMDTRNISFNRCYEPEELENLDVLQYTNDTRMQNIIKAKETGFVKSQKINQQAYSLTSDSYELITEGSDIDPFNALDAHNPLCNLTKGLLGYIGGQVGYITVSDLARNAFFTVPQGFIRAEVNYNCRSCECCHNLWKQNNFTQATTAQFDRTSPRVDDGSIFCYETARKQDPDGTSPKCAGACRFFPTLYFPWGTAMSNSAGDLLNYIETPHNTNVLFFTQLLYASISRVYPVSNYDLTFLEIKRDQPLWNDLIEEYGPIPECSDRAVEVTICNGTSICASANPYNPFSSGNVQVSCTNYPNASNTMDKAQCTNTVKTLGLKFRGRKESTLERVCEEFQCERVASSRVTWNTFNLTRGEVALSRMIFLPAIRASYIPGLCTNNYSDVIVRREGQQLLSIHRTQCANSTNGTSRGCWLTGDFKNFTDLQTAEWQHELYGEDHGASERMFACYRFAQKPRYKWVYQAFCTVSGVVGSWFLVVCGIYWLLVLRIMPWLQYGFGSSSNETARTEGEGTPLNEIVSHAPSELNYNSCEPAPPTLPQYKTSDLNLFTVPEDSSIEASSEFATVRPSATVAFERAINQIRSLPSSFRYASFKRTNLKDE